MRSNPIILWWKWRYNDIDDNADAAADDDIDADDDHAGDDDFCSRDVDEDGLAWLYSRLL